MSDVEDTTADTTPGAGGAGEGAKTGKTEPKTIKLEDLPDDVRAFVSGKISDAEAKARTTSKANAAKEERTKLLAEFGKVLGITDEEPDAAKLTESLSAARTEADTAARERDAIRIARRLGADDETMLDSASFLAKLHKLDRRGDTYTEDLAALMAKEVEDNPRFKAAGAKPAAATGGGGEFGRKAATADADDDGSVSAMERKLYGKR